MCNHKVHTANGYIWCHEDESKTIQELINKIPLSKAKHPIEQYTLDGKLIKQFNSITDAAQELQIHRSSIENVLTNKTYNCVRFLWKYQDDPKDIMEKVKRNSGKKIT